mmetsp:Transcript_104566/g.239656  ORF Transcript_104566/g.239656 Transcript_104566/m.239656 type:complete len:358 (+) Transcript_104566:48-1121(+)
MFLENTFYRFDERPTAPTRTRSLPPAAVAPISEDEILEVERHPAVFPEGLPAARAESPRVHEETSWSPTSSGSEVVLENTFYRFDPKPETSKRSMSVPPGCRFGDEDRDPAGSSSYNSEEGEDSGVSVAVSDELGDARGVGFILPSLRPEGVSSPERSWSPERHFDSPLSMAPQTYGDPASWARPGSGDMATASDLTGGAGPTAVHEAPWTEVPAGSAEPVETTTVLMKGLARSDNVLTLMDDLNQQGFHGAYNYAFAPVEVLTSGRMRSHGIAFVNFLTTELATEALTSLRLHRRGKLAGLSWASHHGIAQNLRQYKERTLAQGARACMAPLARPWLVRGDTRTSIDFTSDLEPVW